MPQGSHTAIIYYRGKVVGGIYDDRFLVKLVKSAMAMMPNADAELLEVMHEELHTPMKRK